MGYLYFFRERKRLVRFPNEVVEKAESDQRFGETMGKLREVRRSTKHREKLSSMISSGPTGSGDEFRIPDLKHYRVKASELPYPPDWEPWLLGDNSNDCFCCSLSCDRKKQIKPGFTPEEEKREPPGEYPDKFKVTEQKLCSTLDAIQDFTAGNLKTINYTLGVLGFQPLPAEPSENENPEPTGPFNHIAAGVWFFTFAIEELFQTVEDAPTQSEFEELMVEFANLAILVDQVASRTVIYSHLYSAFGETVLTRLRTATDRLHIESTTVKKLKVRPPAKLGRALRLQSSTPPDTDSSSTSGSVTRRPQKNYKIVSRPCYSTPKASGENPWLPFSRESISFKLEYLKEFLRKLQHRIVTLNVQMRFLTDDTFERHLGPLRPNGMKRSGKLQQTFLPSLYSLDVVLYRFSVFGETVPRYERALLETMEAVASDVYEVIEKGERIIEGIVEVRDMVELGVVYMKEVYGISFARLIPKNIQFRSKGSRSVFLRCWRKLSTACYDTWVEDSPGFYSAEFFSTTFPVDLQKRAMIDSKTGHEFALQPAMAGEKRRSRRITFSPNDTKILFLNPQSVSSTFTLDPSMGTGSLWDDLSRADISQLKDQLMGFPEFLDIHPSLRAEIQRRDAFREELSSMYAKEKTITERRVH